jgi:hypothetical protein
VSDKDKNNKPKKVISFAAVTDDETSDKPTPYVGAFANIINRTKDYITES